MASRSGSAGQAAVELVAVLPAIALLALLVWQVVAIAQGALLAGSAARAAARAREVGRPADAAARAVLPASLAARARVVPGPSGGVRVRLRLPAAIPGRGGHVEIVSTAGGGE
jgi:hypothetical protein